MIDETARRQGVGTAEAYVTLGAALERCRAHDVSAHVLTGVVSLPQDVRISISGAPANATVLVAIDGGRSTPPQSVDQSAPETREYYLRAERLVDRGVLRLSRHGREIDVPVVPAAAAALHAGGWSDSAPRFTELCVRSTDFETALGELSLPQREP